jgi:hypothetical protein
MHNYATIFKVDYIANIKVLNLFLKFTQPNC